MVEHRGLVLHIAQGTYAGDIGWQLNPDQRYADGTRTTVSSHFIVGRNKGEAAQVVDTSVTAYTQAGGNGRWISVEFAGFTPQALTDWQIEVAARLLAKGHQVYGWPLTIATSPSGRGLGHHSMGGVAWGNHPQCPGAPIIAQKPLIVARAKELTGEEDMPSEKEIAHYLLRNQHVDMYDEAGKKRWWAGQVIGKDSIPVNSALFYGAMTPFYLRDTILPKLIAAEKRDKAILDAVQGIDTDTILARIDQRTAEDVAREEEASTERAALAQRLDGLVDVLDELRRLVERGQSGALNAAEVVRRMGEALSAIAPAEPVEPDGS